MFNKSNMEVSTFSRDERKTVFNEHRGNRRSMDGSGIAIKLAVCCAAAALVLVIKLISSSGSDTMNATASTEVEDNQLGRLKFVQLPGIIEVFSSAAMPYIALDIETSEYIDDAKMLHIILSGDSSATVYKSCKVMAVGYDSDHGQFVTLAFEGDITLDLYGFSSVSVEEGQPLTTGDTLGAIMEKTTVKVSARSGGSPCDPRKYILPNGET